MFTTGARTDSPSRAPEFNLIVLSGVQLQHTSCTVFRRSKNISEIYS